MAEWLGGILGHFPVWLIGVAIIIIFIAAVYFDFWMFSAWPGGINHYGKRKGKNGKK